MTKAILSSFIGVTSLMLGLALPASAGPHAIELKPLGSVAAGSFLTSAAEIVAHDPATQRLFVVNAQAAQIDIVDIADPRNPSIVDTIDVTAYGAVANSVAVHHGLIAVAVEASPKTDPGQVVFFDSALTFLAAVPVGALPDMLTFTPDGGYVLVANEGEPAPDYLTDPEGTVSIISVPQPNVPFVPTVRTAGFAAFNSAVLDPSIRIFGPGATVAQDVEPEYITLSDDSKTAWVTLQEANAIGVVDIASATVTSLLPLGTKDHSIPGQGLDASDRDGVPVATDGRINIANWPVRGFYLPDAIASYKVQGQTYLVLANEGDSREYPGFAEEARIGAVALDPVAFPTATDLKKNGNLGRLKITKAQGDVDHDGDFDVLYTFGARSFSIRNAGGGLVWDSGDQFEQITAAQLPANFNASNDSNAFDNRSDDKGPEPEGVALGNLWGRNYAFVVLERVGGIMVYDITNPAAPEFVQWANNRDYTANVEDPASGDLGPEGLIFIGAENAPQKNPLLVVSNEVSGTTTIYEITKTK
jgi:DNA-binding beta-propeller fold protein YncE